MSYTIKTLVFEKADGVGSHNWLDLPGMRVVAVLSSHDAGPKTYVTCLVEQP